MNEIQEEVSSFNPRAIYPVGRTIIRFEFNLCEDFAVFDDSFVDSGYYDIFSRTYDVTLAQVVIVDLGDAIDGSYLDVDGDTVVFTSGDVDFDSLPAGGVYNLYCSQVIPAGTFLRFYPGMFVDEGVDSSTLYAEFHYTFDCSNV